MSKKYEVGDIVYLKKPERGYKRVEIVGFDGVRLVVRTDGGLEFTIYEDELDDK